jgi:hypothetical protein
VPIRHLMATLMLSRSCCTSSRHLCHMPNWPLDPASSDGSNGCSTGSDSPGLRTRRSSSTFEGRTSIEEREYPTTPPRYDPAFLQSSVPSSHAVQFLSFDIVDSLFGSGRTCQRKLHRDTCSHAPERLRVAGMILSNGTSHFRYTHSYLLIGNRS